MRKTLTILLAASFLAGCGGARKQARTDGSDEQVDIPARGSGESQAFSLPGVPLKFMPPPVRAKAAAPAPAAEPAPAAKIPPAEAKPAPAEKPAPAAAAAADAANGDLEYHLSSARKYTAKKKYKSAAAEYAAAVPFLPPGDPRAVLFLERQGSMLLRAGSEPKAKEAFLAAIGKAADLKVAGNDLANAHLGLGYCYEKAKNKAEALKNYEKAKELTDSKKTKAKISKTIADLKAAK